MAAAATPAMATATTVPTVDNTVVATDTATAAVAAVANTDYIRIRSKTVLVSPTQEQFDLLRKRLQGRIDDSRGETIFELGIGEGE